MKSKEIVEAAEAAQADFRPCPFCSMYATHAADCIYLVHKGTVLDEAETEEVKKEEPEFDTKEVLKIMKKKSD